MIWVKWSVGAVVLLFLLWGGAVALGARLWSGRVETLIQRMQAAEGSIGARRRDLEAMDALPPPVARYLRRVLPEGVALPLRLEMEHSGRFDMGEGEENWKPFTSRQHVTLERPGFVWDGRIAMAPGLPVRVIDAYVAGEGLLVPAVLGLVPLARLEGGGAIAEGELLRWLAEAAWYPSVLLPGGGVAWRAVDDHSAEAWLRDGAVEVRLLFHFGEDDLIASVRAEGRGRLVAGRMLPTPWEGRWWGYAEKGGILVPTEGEVAWILPDGAKPYWRGRLTDYKPVPLP